LNDFPTPETCKNCTAEKRLSKIEAQLAVILKIVDATAQAVLELKKIVQK